LVQAAQVVEAQQPKAQTDRTRFFLLSHQRVAGAAVVMEQQSATVQMAARVAGAVKTAALKLIPAREYRDKAMMAAQR
jgi:hypothetical protein